MNRTEILQKLNVIFRDVLNNDQILLTENTHANDIEEWDSLNYVLLITAIEKYFKIEFTTAEILEFKKVSDICETITGKL